MLKHDGNRYFKGVRTTDHEGDVDVDRFRSTAAGRDTFAMRAVRVSDGTTCSRLAHRRLSEPHSAQAAGPSSTTTRPPPAGDRSTTRPPPDSVAVLCGDGEAEAGGLGAAGAATYDVDPVREARPVVVDGEHQPAAVAGIDRHRQSGALGGVGEDVVEEHVDQRLEVRLAGVDQRSPATSGRRAVKVAALVLGQRRPEREPARPAPSTPGVPATSPSRSERRASLTTWSTITWSRSRSSPRRARSLARRGARRCAAAAR